MKNLFFIVLSLIFSFFFLFFFFFQNRLQEHFFVQPKTFLLLGDSVLQNKRYVSPNTSIESLLKEKAKETTVLCLAKDNSHIAQVFSQLNQIPSKLNQISTTVFLSVGGNDILDTFFERKTNNDVTLVNKLFESYQGLVESIRIVLPHAKLVLVDVYCPDSFLSLRKVLEAWNTRLYHYASFQPRIKVLKISQQLNQPEDFTQKIEPSEIGGAKIVNLIAQFTHY